MYDSKFETSQKQRIKLFLQENIHCFHLEKSIIIATHDLTSSTKKYSSGFWYEYFYIITETVTFYYENSLWQSYSETLGLLKFW
jgi:hypothetical protein